MKATILHAGLALSLLLLGACSTAPKPTWVDETFEVRTERMLWEVLRISLDRAGYAVGTGAEPTERRIESGWQVDASPFKGQGWRKKAHLEYEPAPDKLGHWLVRVRVQKETNESFKGLDLRYAEWKPTADDEEAAKRITQFARSLLGGGDFQVGPAVRAPGGNGGR